MFRPICAIDNRLVANKANAFPTEAFVEPRALLPHLHRPRTGRPVVTEDVHSALEAKVSVSLFVLLLAALELPVGLHVVAIVCVTMFLKVCTLVSFDFTYIAIAHRTVFLVDDCAFGPSHIPFRRIKKLEMMLGAAMSGV